MKLKLLLVALSVSLVLPNASAHAVDAVPAAPAPVAETVAPADAIKPLAVVNGVELPAIYANFLRQSRINRGASPESLNDDLVRDSAIAAEILTQEAVRKGLDKNPTVLAAMEFQKKELLSQAAIEDFVRSHPVSEETLKAEYDKAQAKAGGTEYRPRHILVNSEKEAKAIIANLTAKGKKAKFEDLARKQSKDTSAGNGGDLGWTLPANLVPEFAEVMVNLKKGETSKTPVQTQFGWHVIRLDDTRKLEFPTYDKIKGRIANQLQQQQLRKYVQELRASAKIE